MIEIIPNWHPVLVHFTIGLLAISTTLYAAGYVLKKENLLIAARWNLWLGALITIGTVVAGFHAYNTVVHDGLSHQAMTDHRNWALPTNAVYLVLAGWALVTQRQTKTVSLTFLIAILLASPLLAITGYKGSEVVYRHGTGVMRIPEIHSDSGHDSHSHGDNEHYEMTMPHHSKNVPKPDTKPQTDHGNDNHDHATHNH